MKNAHGHQGASEPLPTGPLPTGPLPPEPLPGDAPGDPAGHPVRVGTVVWGAVVLVLAALMITARQANLALDPGLTAMWLLLGAGVAMVAGGAVHVLRRR